MVRLSERCRRSVEFRATASHGVGFRLGAVSKPHAVWEDSRRFPEGRAPWFARRFPNEDDVRNNMPFYRDELCFVFNGELRGVRLRAPGRIGAEKIFHVILEQGACLPEALAAADRLLRSRARYVRAMNVALTDGSAIYAHCRFAERPDYFTLHYRVGDLSGDRRSRSTRASGRWRTARPRCSELDDSREGGGAERESRGIAFDLAELGEPAVVVHGANAARDELAARVGAPKRTVISESGVESVFTDAEALEILTMAYAGLVNKRFVSLCQRNGVNAIGLTGLDGALIRGRRNRGIRVAENGRRRLLHDDSGKPVSANAGLFGLLLGSGYTPVVTVPILDEEGRAINTENDEVTALLQRTLGAEVVVQLIEAPGLLSDPARPESLLSTLGRQRSKRGSRSPREVPRKLMAFAR
jgi:acetylglutamate/LysW-gamma-L-alpha-aminoadipate kinase